MRLEPQALIEAAQRETGLADFGAAPFGESLERLCRALNVEAGLDEAGFAAASRMIGGALAERLRIEDWIARRPEILDQTLAAPVNVIGLPRSGTTALQQFLSADPALRVIRRWELASPTPPPDDALGDADPRIAATRAAFEERDRRLPSFRVMLPVAAEDPSEHNTPMTFSFLNLQHLTLYDVPGYQAWLLGQDLAPGYAYLARVLKLLQWKAPRERWCLKNPMDLFVLPAFADVFPGAKSVWIHRDPAATIGSICSLIALVRESLGQTSEPRRLGGRLLELLAEGLRRAMRDRDERRLDIVDLHNGELGRDPRGAIRALYERLELSFTPAFERNLGARMAAKPRGRFGRHSYALEDFGLTAAQVRAQFRDYIDRFKPPPET